MRRFTGRSWALLTSIAVVVLAVLTLLITGSPDSDPAAATTPEPTATPTTERDVPRDAKPKPDREREKPRRERPAKPSAYVEVFNNSGVTGLAGQTADQLAGAGWQVVGTDNWYGDIPATTVYYPPRLRPQAVLLADEVGATRLRPAVDPMRFDRLTLILTGDL